ncbi:hypothetical protein ICJ83_03445 [Aestuariibaculum sp. TT11]|uniref:Uncharacterized protein n=2 Tax=Aestuariibaculum sediminum TaxID=2770637 RepID=A0A8J6UBQ0_9FLAO|nr:hypothetical protein [Aestuariibaculum sediminum]
MTFSSGASEPGFTFSGWTPLNNGVIFISNNEQFSSATCSSSNSEIWNFISFHVGPYLQDRNFQVESDKGDLYNFTGNIEQDHTLN